MSCDRCGTRDAKRMIGPRKGYNVLDKNEAVCSGLIRLLGVGESQRSKRTVSNDLTLRSIGIY